MRCTLRAVRRALSGTKGESHTRMSGDASHAVRIVPDAGPSPVLSSIEDKKRSGGETKKAAVKKMNPHPPFLDAGSWWLVVSLPTRVGAIECPQGLAGLLATKDPGFGIPCRCESCPLLHFYEAMMNAEKESKIR